MERRDTGITHAASGGPVMLFDGVCNLCAGWVRFAIARDPAERLRFAAVQSPVGQAFLARQGLPLEVYETFYFVEDGVVYEKSTAWLRMLRYLNWPWPWSWVFTVVPRWLRDPIYELHREQSLPLVRAARCLHGADAGDYRAVHRLACRGAAQAVVDGAAEAGVGNRHHGDGAAAGPVEPAQHGEEVRGGFYEIA